MKYCWSYCAKWNRITSSGTLGIMVYSPKQTTMKIVGINAELGNPTTAKTLRMYQELYGSGAVSYADFKIIIDHVTNDFHYPNKDILESHGYMEQEAIQLFPRDWLDIFFTDAAAGQWCTFTIRAILSSYAIPTITTAAADDKCTLGMEYTNWIVGVEK